MFSPEPVGKQCVPNCVMAIAYIINISKSQIAVRTFGLHSSNWKQPTCKNC